MDASADLLKVNHRLESRVPEIGLLGSEGGATSSVVPTPIVAGGAPRSDYFQGAYQRFNSYQKQKPSCQSSFRTLLGQDCPLLNYSKNFSRCGRRSSSMVQAD